MTAGSPPERSYITDLLRGLDLSAGPPRVLILGPDPVARALATDAILRRASSGERTPVHTVAGTVPPDAVVLIRDLRRLTEPESGTLAELVRRGDVTVIGAAARLDAQTAALHAEFAVHGTVLRLPPLRRNQIRALAAEHHVELDEGDLGELETASAGRWEILDACLADMRDTRRSASEALEGALRHHVAALDPLERDVLAISQYIPDVGVDEVNLGATGPELGAVFDAAAGSGLTGSAAPVVRTVLAEACGTMRIRAAVMSIVESRCSADALDVAVACRVFDAGIRHAVVLAALRTHLTGATPSVADELFRRLDAADCLSHAERVQYARLAASRGDLDTACTLADRVLSECAPDDSVAVGAVAVRAGVSALCGQLDAAADLFAWLGPDRAGTESAFAAVTFATTGNLDAAMTAVASLHRLPAGAGTGPALAAIGLAESITESIPAALTTLSRALTAPGRTTTADFQPDSAPALAALAFLHSGSLARAAAALDSAITSDAPGTHTWARHHTLRAAVAMTAGDPDALANLPHDVTSGSLRQRDSFWLHSVKVGIARRSGDLALLRRAWTDAAHTVAACRADLLNLVPLGEFWLAAVRLDEFHTIAHVVDDALALVCRLGEPPLWSSPLHWYGIQASILAQSPTDLLPHAQALSAAAQSHRYAAVLAAAGRAWLLLLQGGVGADAIENAARGLDRVGLSWDAARLAGEAALRAPDTASATALLHLARSLRAPAGADLPATGASTHGLTEREGEVAQLVVAGLTYREIGERLYVSAKTVEHHVARIKRRLGVASRSELLVVLRAMHAPPEQALTQM